MILTIDNSRFVEDLQEQFSKCFPGLKIEFFKKHHGAKKASTVEDLIKPDCLVGDIRKKGINGSYTIRSTDSVRKVEEDLYQQFGLNAQIYRNENDGWIQTTSTDRFTLGQQIKMSRHSNRSIFPKVNDQLSEYGYL